MSTAQKSKRKNNRTKSASSGSNQFSVWLGWLPVFGLVFLTSIAGLLIYQLIEQGKIEGHQAFGSGRYVEVFLSSGNVSGYLLPVAPKWVDDGTLSPEQQAILAASNGDDDSKKDKVKLREAPNMTLVENSKSGMIPIISSDGVKPWQYYARSFTKEGNMSLVSVVVTGLGINKELSIAVSRLPGEICLSVSPYAKDVPVWMQSMRAQGHEFLLDLPTQTMNFPMTDPGPEALMTNIMPEENAVRLQKVMASSTGYVGFTVPNDEVFFESDKDFVEPVVKELANRGLMAVFTKTQERTEFTKLIKEEKLANIVSDIHIRYGADINEIVQRFSAAESISIKRGSVLLVIEASPIALEELKKWVSNLNSKGFQLAPVSVLAR